MIPFGAWLILFSFLLIVLWALFFFTRKLVILWLCRRALKRDDRNRVDFILSQARDQAYLSPLDVYQIRLKLFPGNKDKKPVRSRSGYFPTAIKRTFLFWRKSK